LLIAPQFLNEEDAAAHKQSADVLRWRKGQWEAGEPATRPAGTGWEILYRGFLL
jgi:hypothetical protein